MFRYRVMDVDQEGRPSVRADLEELLGEVADCVVCRIPVVCDLSEEPTQVNLSASILDGCEMLISASSIEIMARSPSAAAEESIHFRPQPVEKRRGWLALRATDENIG
jgi:hypothetical protein